MLAIMDRRRRLAYRPTCTCVMHVLRDVTADALYEKMYGYDSRDSAGSTVSGNDENDDEAMASGGSSNCLSSIYDPTSTEFARNAFIYYFNRERATHEKRRQLT